jgi:hypothetical protein
MKTCSIGKVKHIRTTYPQVYSQFVLGTLNGPVSIWHLISLLNMVHLVYISSKVALIKEAVLS